MATKARAHSTNTVMVRAAGARLAAGAEMALKVSVSCPSACDLRGREIRIIARDGSVVATVPLTEVHEAAAETGEFVVKAPAAAGEHTWTAEFPEQGKGGIAHEVSTASFSFAVAAHATSLAVWDVQSPAVVQAPFAIKVGAKCAADCRLAGAAIEVWDEAGTKLAEGRLGGEPWPRTETLWWTEVQLRAPATEGVHAWQVRLPEQDLELPHEAASFQFTFPTARPAEHTVTVEVFDPDSKAPLPKAVVTLRPHLYRGYTDEQGVARIAVAEGKYSVHVKKAQYEAFKTTVEVSGDVSIRAEPVPIPPEDTSIGYG